MAAYQERLRNHLWVASWEEAFVTPEPVCSSSRPGQGNMYEPEGSLTGCFFPQSLEPLLGTHPHRYYGPVRYTDSSLLSPCPVLAHHDVIVFAEYTHLQGSAQSGGAGRGRRSLLLSVFLWHPVDPGFKTCSRGSWGNRECPP